jgi:hypothetical protein
MARIFYKDKGKKSICSCHIRKKKEKNLLQGQRKKFNLQLSHQEEERIPEQSRKRKKFLIVRETEEIVRF